MSRTSAFLFLLGPMHGSGSVATAKANAVSWDSFMMGRRLDPWLILHSTPRPAMILLFCKKWKHRFVKSFWQKGICQNVQQKERGKKKGAKRKGQKLIGLTVLRQRFELWRNIQFQTRLRGPPSTNSGTAAFIFRWIWRFTMWNSILIHNIFVYILETLDHKK